MSVTRLAAEIARLAPELRGRLAADAPLAPFTWFRVGGPAEVLFSPADEDDLAYFLRTCRARFRSRSSASAPISSSATAGFAAW